MKKLFKLYLLVSICLMTSCKCYNCGGLGIVSHIEDKEPNKNTIFHDEYHFDSIGLASRFSSKEVANTPKYLVKSKVPKDYLSTFNLCKYDSINVLYSARENNKNSTVVCVLYKTNIGLSDFENQIKKEIDPFVNGIATERLEIEGLKTTHYQYSIKKNSKTAFYVSDYYVRWSDKEIIRLTAIQKCQEVIYPFYNSPSDIIETFLQKNNDEE